MNESCPECGALWTDNLTCRDAFHQMLYWENEDPARGAVHHLMVLCYHLQHPSLYSAEGLAHARELLTDFVVRGLEPAAVRHRNRGRVASGNRAWAISARPGNHGAYEQPPGWTMTAIDVVAAGAEAYCESTRAWADSVHASLSRQP